MRQKNVPARQRALADAIGEPRELLSLLRLDPAAAGLRAGGRGRFPLRIPRGYAARMRPGDPDDPLLAQILPRAVKGADRPGCGDDPVGDAAAIDRPGVLHKYRGRVLQTGHLGVNDSAPTRAELSWRLFAFGALPYYLHLLDRVRGAARFDVIAASARLLHSDLAARLPGYLVPRLVREVPGRPGKTPLPFDWPQAAYDQAG